MSDDASSRRTKTPLAASHQKSWLWGRHALLETLTAARWPVLELYADRNLPGGDLDELRRLIDRQRLELKLVTAARLSELSKAKDHQGFLARMGAFPYLSLENLGPFLSDIQKAASVAPLFVICDRIQDAHNFGAILRSCDAVNAAGVIIGERSQVVVTPHVARSSAGAANYQTIFRVTELAAAIDVLKAGGVRVVAATEKATESLWTSDLRSPLGLLIGTESTGISPNLLRQCDLQISIPMMGRGTSLNAAVAAGILLFESRRQSSRSVAG